MEFGETPRWLGGEIAATLVLHTWGQTLTQHLHLHCLIAAGALGPDGRWIHPRRGFLFPVKALSPVFRGKFLASLSRALDTCALRLEGSTGEIAQLGAHARFLAGLRATAVDILHQCPRCHSGRMIVIAPIQPIRSSAPPRGAIPVNDPVGLNRSTIVRQPCAPSRNRSSQAMTLTLSDSSVIVISSTAHDADPPDRPPACSRSPRHQTQTLGVLLRSAYKRQRCAL